MKDRFGEYIAIVLFIGARLAGGGFNLLHAHLQAGHLQVENTARLDIPFRRQPPSKDGTGKRKIPSIAVYEHRTGKVWLALCTLPAPWQQRIKAVFTLSSSLASAALSCKVRACKAVQYIILCGVYLVLLAGERCLELAHLRCSVALLRGRLLLQDLRNAGDTIGIRCAPGKHAPLHMQFRTFEGCRRWIVGE